jgi:proline iminopeptidase
MASESVGGGRGMSDRMTTAARRLVRNTRRDAGADLHEITERRPGAISARSILLVRLDAPPCADEKCHSSTNALIATQLFEVSMGVRVSWKFLMALVFVAAVLAVLWPQAAFAQPRSGTFTRPGATIAFEVRGAGDGTALVVVNGGPGFDHSYLVVFIEPWDALARNRRVIFYDQRGTGKSPTIGDQPSYTLAEQIGDLDALRAHLGLQRIDLLGHSWGGFLAMAYAARHPEHVAHLIIADSGAPKLSDTLTLFKDVFPETTERRQAVAFADALGDPEATQADLREYLTMLFYSPQKRDAYLARYSPGGFRQETYDETWKDASRFDLNPELRKYRFPTLVVTGRFDINVAPSVAYKIHQAVPGSRFVVFEHSGHLPFYEEPEAFVRVVEEFLGEN